MAIEKLASGLLSGSARTANKMLKNRLPAKMGSITEIAAKNPTKSPFKVTLKRPRRVKMPKPSLEDIMKLTKSGTKSLVSRMQPKAESALTQDFLLKKQKLIQELSKVGDKNHIAQIEQARTPEQLAKVLLTKDVSEMSNISILAIKEGVMTPMGKLSKKFMPLNFEQMLEVQRIKRTEYILARERALHVPSQNPQVIAIENILKEQYGAKFVSLKDNEALAKQILKAYEIAAKNGVKLPKNVVVSDFMLANGENLTHTILLNSDNRSFTKGFCSTESDFHVPLHEIMHGEHPNLISFMLKKIPEKYLKTQKALSEYAGKNCAETFTELNTKRLINGLNKDEQALYDYLNVYG